MNFIFIFIPDRVSKKLVICSLNFPEDSFINKAQFDAGFSERLKLKDDAVPTILDLTVISQVWVTLLCNPYSFVCYIERYGTYLCILHLD